MIQNERDYEALLHPLLSFGQQMLDTYGAFYPYAAVVSRAGEVTLVAREVDEATPEPARVLAVLREALCAQASDDACQASGLCVNVRVVDPRTGLEIDALKFSFEHRSGESLDVFFLIASACRVASGSRSRSPNPPSAGCSE